MKKLQNSFNVFLPQNYLDFRRTVPDLTSNQAVVAELLRVCCEEDDVKAMRMAFERILGKPEKVIVIKHTLARTVFPDAKTKQPTPPVLDHVEDETAVVKRPDAQIVVDEADAPGYLLRKELDSIGEKGQQYAYDVGEHKNLHTVAEVFAANVYAVAMRGGNLGAIDLLFNYLDGAVADVIRLDGTNTIMLENYADVAPYEARLDETGVYYVETEAVK